MAKRKPAKGETAAAEMRRRLFVAYYTGSCRGNAAAAAKQAGYSGDGKALAQRGYELLKEADVRKQVEAAVSGVATDQAEVLSILVKQMRGDMRDFITIDDEGQARIDLAKAESLGQLGLIKKIRDRTKEFTDPEGNTESTRTIEVELHDQQGAARLVGTILGMFAKRKEQVQERRIDYIKLLALLQRAGVPIKAFPGLADRVRQIESRVVLQEKR